jgi:hypothetical protein
MPEDWATDDDLRAARERTVAQLPGPCHASGYGVARKDGSKLTFGP